jgi:hypothetical protein
VTGGSRDPSAALRPCTRLVAWRLPVWAGPAVTAAGSRPRPAGYLARHGRALRPTTGHRALGDLREAGLASTAADGCWKATPPPCDPLLELVDLRGAHDFRHTFATWLEDSGIPARVIDEVMGHKATSRAGQRGAPWARTTVEAVVGLGEAKDQAERWQSQPVAGGESSVGLAGALVGGRGAVAVQHRS